jgi:signal transduction histidine kinase
MTSFSFLHDKKTPETISLNKELKKTIYIFENSFQDIDFIVEIDESTEAHVRINTTDLNVILNNVLLNAIKHSKKKIYLTSHISTKEQKVYFTIRNSVGTNNTLNEVGNLGIGLKLSKKLLSQYDSFAYFNVHEDFFSVTLSFPLYEAKTEL